MFAEILRGVATDRAVPVFAYCFMPDHIHMLVQSTKGDSLIDFVAEFKQRAAYRYTRATGRRLWQKSYHDRFLRSEDDLLAAAKYVFANPVRDGLVARAD